MQFDKKIVDKELGKKIGFLLLFALAAFLADQIKVASLVGAPNQFFTLFQLVGPIAGAFLGPVIGVVSVLLAQVANFFLLGKQADLITILRFTPMLFAAFYFASSKRVDWILGVPIAAMAAFMLHPIGAQVWYFSLYWLIPIAARLLAPNNLLAKSLGTTFTAHAVGGVLWIYATNMGAEAWIALIPVVAIERTAFAIGIAATYIAFNTVLDLAYDKLPQGIVSVNKKYSLLQLVSHTHA